MPGYMHDFEIRLGFERELERMGEGEFTCRTEIRRMKNSEQGRQRGIWLTHTALLERVSPARLRRRTALGFMVRTGQTAWRTTFSATLPMSNRLMPVRPWVASTIKSIL